MARSPDVSGVRIIATSINDTYHYISTFRCEPVNGNSAGSSLNTFADACSIKAIGTKAQFTVFMGARKGDKGALGPLEFEKIRHMLPFYKIS